MQFQEFIAVLVITCFICRLYTDRLIKYMTKFVTEKLMKRDTIMMINPLPIYVIIAFGSTRRR